MKRAVLWQLSVRTTPAAEEAAGVFLADTFRQAPVSYTNFESGQTTVSVYLAQRPDWDRSRRTELATHLRQTLGSARILRASPLVIRLQRVRREDWTESWKRHFKPI